MNWYVKYLLRHTMIAFPGGEQAYRWMTAALLGSQAGMAYKWFRVFPAHLRVLQEVFGAEARKQRLWCFDSGATMAAGLVIAIASDVPGLLTDRRDRLSWRYTGISRRVLREKGEELARLCGAPDDRVEKLRRLSTSLSPMKTLTEAGISYASRHSVAQDAPWQQQIGCVFSAGTLEHYTPEELEKEVAGMARALCPGGVMSHVVDHRDHRWHADKTISPLAHLAIDEASYQRQFANPLDYHNRWLRSRYIELFTRHGFQVTCRDHVDYTAGLPPLPRDTIAEPFRRMPEDDLRHLVTHFIAVRQEEDHSGVES